MNNREVGEQQAQRAGAIRARIAPLRLTS